MARAQDHCEGAVLSGESLSHGSRHLRRSVWEKIRARGGGGFEGGKHPTVRNKAGGEGESLASVWFIF